MKSVGDRRSERDRRREREGRSLSRDPLVCGVALAVVVALLTCARVWLVEEVWAL